MTITNPLDPILDVTEVGQRAATRAAAHSAHPMVLRSAQRWHEGVTDEMAARVMLALEYYRTKPYRNVNGRWFPPTGSALAGYGRNLSPIVGEMIRTGLVRHWIDRDGDHLIPAPVHYMIKDTEKPGMVRAHSACLFVGEDLGPMRARLVDRLDLTDCLSCEAAIATGSSRKL